MQNHIALNTKLILTPRRAALLAGFDNQLDILVRPEYVGDTKWLP